MILSARYAKLKTPPHNVDVNRWLSEWETTYADCEAQGLAEVANKKATLDFIGATERFHKDFYTSWFFQLFEKKGADEVPTLYEAIGMFR